MELKLFTKEEKMTNAQRQEIAGFLHLYLDQYGDPVEDIEKAIEYAVSDAPGKGGFVLTAYVDAQLMGAVVINRTGMCDYIPENLLVYVAVHKEWRGKGMGRLLVLKAIEQAEGDIALHVESENPARRLYQKLGFENKYLEMRLIKKRT